MTWGSGGLGARGFGVAAAPGRGGARRQAPGGAVGAGTRACAPCLPDHGYFDALAENNIIMAFSLWVMLPFLYTHYSRTVGHRGSSSPMV